MCLTFLARQSSSIYSGLKIIYLNVALNFLEGDADSKDLKYSEANKVSSCCVFDLAADSDYASMGKPF